MRIKLFFWDWLNTLYSYDYFSNLEILNAASKQLLPSFDLDRLSILDSIKIQSYLKKNKKGAIVPCMAYLVHALKKREVKQVIISNGSFQEISPHLNDLDCFDLILTAEEYKPKPSLEMFHFALHHFSIKNQDEVVFAGDSESDEEAALKLGIKFFKIKSYYQNAFEIANYLNLID